MKNRVKRHLHVHNGGHASGITAELRPAAIPGSKGDCSHECEKSNDDPDDLEEERENLTVAGRNAIERFSLQKFKDWAKGGMSMPHATRAEAKRIHDGNGLVVHMESTVLPLYQRFKGCDFEAKEGAMEYCWQLVRKKRKNCVPLRTFTPPGRLSTGADCDEADRE
jgi:hypothetical protein